MTDDDIRHDVRQLCRALRAVPFPLPDDVETAQDLVVWLCAFAGIEGDGTDHQGDAAGTFCDLFLALSACGFFIPAAATSMKHLTYAVLAFANKPAPVAVATGTRPPGFDWRTRMTPGGN